MDTGASRAVRDKGRSLLPIGVVRVVGSFHKGDVGALCNPEGVEFARGLTNYPAAAVERNLFAAADGSICRRAGNRDFPGV